MILIAGLGNPGAQYQDTRHNVGFMCVDAIAKHFKASSFETKFGSLFSSFTHNSQKVLLCKPETYMNLSGKAVQAFLSFYKIPTENLWVIHDDIELPLGVVKTKLNGGNAGHNGLRDIDGRIGKGYHRIRVGIDRPLHKDRVSDYVLSSFTKPERTIINETIFQVIECIENEALGKG